MEKLMIKIVNVETGEEIEREMNEQEYAQYQIDKKHSEIDLANQKAQAAAKAALLERLGITEEEAKLLLG